MDFLKTNLSDFPSVTSYSNVHFISSAMDGTIKVWYYETIELADPPEEDRFIEVEPIFEYEVGDYYHKAELMVIVKCDPDDEEDFFWFGQVESDWII